MTKQVWINLPVKDVSRSKKFYQELGFRTNIKFGDKADSASLLIGEKDVVLMLFDQETFKTFTDKPISKQSICSDVLFSLDAESKEEVDEMANRAVKAGGTSPHVPKEAHGWMYGCLFADPDGHCWNVLFMDMSKMPG